MTPTFWQRNRRRILIGAVAAGATVAVGYYAYSKWRQMADDFNAYLESLVADELGAARKNGGRRAGQGLDKITEKSGEGCDSSMQTHVEDVEEAKNDDGEAGAERMAQHFRSIQKIADSTTVPSLVPHLRSRLYELDDIRRITESLNDSSLPREDRQVLFSDLARAGFARALAVAWLLPLLQLFIKVQLNVLGRHLFFETNEPGPASPAGGSEGGGEESRGALAGESRASSTQSLGRLLPAKLTLRCQQKFLSFAEYLAQCGVEAVAREALAVAREMMLDVDLAKSMREAEMRGLMMQLHANFEARIASEGWSRLLLPQALAHLRSQIDGASCTPSTLGTPEPPASSRLSWAQLTAGTGGLSSSVDSVLDEGDLQVLEGLLNETRRVLSTRSFDEALRAAAMHTSRTVASGAAAQAFPLGNGVEGSAPQVRTIQASAAVSAAAGALLEQPGDVIMSMGGLREVVGLCEGTYAGQTA